MRMGQQCCWNQCLLRAGGGGGGAGEWQRAAGKEVCQADQ